MTGLLGFPDFLWRALLGGLGLALAAGPLGCFVVWRRMAFFGDTMAHAALLGVALGTLLQTSLNLSIGAVCLVMAVALSLLSRQKSLATDTLLGILAHSALALGLITLSFLNQVRFDLNSYLFGDLLAIGRSDIYWIYGAAVLTGFTLIRFWRGLMMATIHEELAKVEGIPVERLRLILMVLFALVIAFAMKIVGVLLITAMLIIPAATARRLAPTPERMAWFSIGFGLLSVTGGLSLSWRWDTPAGPSIVASAFAFFLLVYLLRRKHPI